MPATQLRWLAFTLALAALGACPPQLSAEEQKWGDLQMRFQIEGALPPPKAPTVFPSSDGVANVVDESLVINRENRGIANIIAWVRVDKRKCPVHPSYEKSSKDKIFLAFDEMKFVPHVQSVRTSQPLAILNKDKFGHNANVQPMNTPIVGRALPVGPEDIYKFDRAESLPTRVACNIHPWEGAWLVVLDHPYVGISDADGKIKIVNLPVGDWEFQFWQERSGYVKKVVRNGKTEAWPKGRQTIFIKEGNNDLGPIGVPIQLFEEKQSAVKKS